MHPRQSLNVTAARQVDGELLEHRFTLGDVPGILWTPAGETPSPLILLGHPGGWTPCTRG